MARKFNLGRQSEHGLNKEMHDLLMSLKYINNGVDEPMQDYQTPIPLGSVWNDNKYGKNILKVNTSNNGWDPMFRDYYHPVDLFTKPLSPVHGQLWIDGSKDNTLHFYDSNTNAWIAIRAAQSNSNQILVDMHNNFMHMYPLKDMDEVDTTSKSFLVPDVYYGKLTDNGNFIHPSDSSKYEVISEVGIKHKTTSKESSWIHVNPHKLYTMDKKLVKVFKSGSDAYKIYGLYDNNTEFFYLNSSSEWIHMLPYDAVTGKGDFKAFDKGIEIISSRAKVAEFVMMYAYSFYDTARPGKLIRKDFITGDNSEVNIGQLTKDPMLFLDGLYLEQHMYDYDNKTGNATIHDKIVNPMNLMSIVFKTSETADFEINQTVNGTNDALVGTLVNTYSNPIVFVSGVMSFEMFGPDQIKYDRNNKTITIKNWGPHQPGDISYVMIVEGEGMYLEHGHFDNTRTIRNSEITINRKYMVWADGVLISSKDLDISLGEIRLANAVEGAEYMLLQITDEENTGFVFDGKVMNYTIAIKNEDGSLYNECDNACVFVNGKALMMEDTILKENLPIKGANGQIVKVKNTIDENSNIYDYLIYNHNTAQWTTLSIQDVSKVDALIKADFSSGTISVDSNGGLRGTYYAYTYANSIEEPLLTGKRVLEKDKTEYKVNLTHMFNVGQQALSVYVNKLLSHDVVEEGSNVGKFIVPIQEGPAGNLISTSPYTDGELFYIVEKAEKHETQSCRREVLTALNRNTQYANGYDTSIPLMPGVVSVYLNGVRLENRDFTVIDDNTIILHIVSVGGQRNYDAENQDTWNKYLFYNKDGEVELTSVRDDYLIVEVREDYNLKTVTIPVRYTGQKTFYMEDDGIPKSLILTQDYIKIYINGIVYDGEYTINRETGSISLLSYNLENMLNVDPIAKHFEINQEAHEKYIMENGKPYIAKKIIDNITFEWR